MRRVPTMCWKATARCSRSTWRACIVWRGGAGRRKSQVAEEFRIIKRPLIANAFGQGTARVKNGNLIMVTSSLPGGRQEFLAINLAISMAMEMESHRAADRRDVAKPRIPELSWHPRHKGLLDVLQDKA